MTGTEPSTTESHAARPWYRDLRFLGHYLEMILAMVAGMFLLGAATDALAALAGGRPAFLDLTEVAFLKAALDMSVGMVLWMRLRGHSWRAGLEMSAAMFAPAVPLFPALWLGLISAGTLDLLGHLAMLPLMLVVMLRGRH
ncbi:hypothetical protein LX16_1202 [Stackebrandtia albiflava]|uniref:Flagellar biosynthetic protein FliP n=1 Tax=Stackebrandtia albiflava TaxID=406432 RepID=A0A562VCA4_9ACTN|nr:hypothetical protein [Stackebrandtia albiflava]TWJ15492.1 hypothetical protein LX16_1202 [Stackebrandtia albiflava]